MHTTLSDSERGSMEYSELARQKSSDSVAFWLVDDDGTLLWMEIKHVDGSRIEYGHDEFQMQMNK